MLYGEMCDFQTEERLRPRSARTGPEKQSEYCLQLREKQKTKRYYGILEKQFHTYFVMASKKSGVTGENLLVLLERRLDNVVYRLGLGSSRAEARQLVLHGHFTVNGKRVNIPSFLVSANDVIAVCDKSRTNGRIAEILNVTSGRAIPEWLSFDADKLQGTVLTYPKREDIDLPVQEHLIVELYNK